MFTFYEVGGKVRDELLGLQSKDIDYVAVVDDILLNTDTRINKWFNALEVFLVQQGYQIFLSTPEMYTIRAKFPKGHKNKNIVADFVLARKEIGYKEDTREPIVIPGTLLDDLHRRDFTVNAIAKAEDGTLIDPFDGQKHIKEMVLHTPISGDITFDDDPLRLLRAIRFNITKGFSLDSNIYNFILNFNYMDKFHVVSEERIREELFKCFKHDTLRTLKVLNWFAGLREYIFTKTNLWLKPTNEQ